MGTLCRVAVRLFLWINGRIVCEKTSAIRLETLMKFFTCEQYSRFSKNGSGFAGDRFCPCEAENVNAVLWNIDRIDGSFSS